MSKIKIAINGLAMKSRRAGGVDTFLVNIIKYLEHIADERFEYILYANKATASFFSNYKYLNLKVCSGLLDFPVIRFIYEQFILPIRLYYEKIFIFFNPTSIGLFTFNKKSILVIHDLVHLRFGKNLPLGTYLIRKFLLPLFSKRASKIVVLTDAMKNEIIEKLEIDGKKIALIYSGIDNYYRKQESIEVERIRDKYNLPRPYLIYPASFLRNKNHINLLKAFLKISNETKLPHLLVLMGVRTKGYKLIDKYIRDKGLTSDVKYLGFVPDDDMAALYSGAELTVFPSLYEGFGFPILEAMACECPVIVSNFGAMAEIANDAAYLVNPNDPDDIAKGIKELFCNKALRQELIKKGLKRSAEFSWEKSAAKYQELFKEISEASSRQRTKT
jgi:glycosyltransferase involved in cell wall biosynthesis